MCTIYEFPTAKKLPREIEERLQLSAKDYVEVLYEVLEYFDNERSTDEELLKVTEMVMNVYLEAISKTIEEL